jgi:hypothetical protein
MRMVFGVVVGVAAVVLAVLGVALILARDPYFGDSLLGLGTFMLLVASLLGVFAVWLVKERPTKAVRRTARLRR